MANANGNEKPSDEEIAAAKTKLAAAGERVEQINAADANLREAGEAYATRAKEVGEALRDAKTDCGRADIPWSEWCPKHGPKYTVQHADRLIRVADEWEKIEQKLNRRVQDMSLRAVLALLPKKRRNQNAAVERPRLKLDESEVKEAAKQTRISLAMAMKFLELLKVAVRPEKVPAAAAA